MGYRQDLYDENVGSRVTGIKVWAKIRLEPAWEYVALFADSDNITVIERSCWRINTRETCDEFWGNPVMRGIRDTDCRVHIENSDLKARGLIPFAPESRTVSR